MCLTYPGSHVEGRPCTVKHDIKAGLQGSYAEISGGQGEGEPLQHISQRQCHQVLLVTRGGQGSEVGTPLFGLSSSVDCGWL